MADESDLRMLLRIAPVLPVVTIDEVARALDLARAPAAGGIGIAGKLDKSPLDRL